MEKKIDKKSLIGEVIERCPAAVEIMFEYGLHCVGCCGSAFETIEEGAQAHGLSEEKVEEMIKKINEKISEKKKD